LQGAPALSCLVTSRRRLEIEGERVFPVLPLPTPASSAAAAPEAVLAFPSVRMFLDRAQSTDPGFEITGENAAAVAALCHRLDGIPLAIELAASWAGVLTPEQMLSRLNRRFELLVSRRKDLDPRHRSLRATLEWSFRQLPPDLGQFLTCLSV